MIDCGLIFKKFNEDQIQAYADSGAEGIGDEVGDVAGTEREGKLAKLQREAEEESGQNGSA